MAAKQPSKLRAIGLILIGAVVIYFSLNFFTGRQPIVDTVKVKIAGPPRIESIPGSVKDNALYKELQEKENKKRTEEAKKTGRSNLPTLVNKTNQQDSADLEMFNPQPKISEEPVKPSREDALKKAQEDADRRLKEQQARLDKLRQEQEDKRKQSEKARQDAQKAQQNMKELEGRINTDLAEMAILSKGMTNVVKQVYVAGKDSPKPVAKQENATANNIAPLYKAGSIIYGVIETDYNSDNAGPILARITSGPLAGSVLIGSTSGSASPWASGLGITFNTLSRPNAIKSQAINLVAVNPENKQPVVGSNVNYHYGQRYGALLMSGALSQGVNQAQSAASNSSSSSSSSQNSNTSQSGGSSASSTISLATPIANDIISNLNQVASRPATYMIDQGTAIGLLFVNDFILES